MEPKRQKSIGYVRLVDACGRRGCPVCRCVQADSRQYLDALLYEQVTDPDTRRRLRASWGFCNWHAWMLLEIASSGSGSAIIYGDLIGLLIRRVRRLADRPARPLRKFAFWRSTRSFGRRLAALVEIYQRRPVCPACASAADAESRCVSTLLTFIDDPELDAAYAGSDGICTPHALRAIEMGRDGPGLRPLLDRTLPKWTALQRELERFVQKHDYRNAEAFTEGEATSCVRAFEVLAGGRGVFGNDVHGQRGAGVPAGRSRRRSARPKKTSPGDAGS